MIGPNVIAKEEMEKIIKKYSANIPQQPEEQYPVSQGLALTSHTRVYTAEYTFVHSEIEDD